MRYIGRQWVNVLTVMTKLRTNLKKPTTFSCDQVLKGKQYNVHIAVLEKYNALVFCVFSEKMNIQ